MKLLLFRGYARACDARRGPRRQRRASGGVPSAPANWRRWHGSSCPMSDATRCLVRYHPSMTTPVPLTEDDEAEAEVCALAAAIAESDADPRTVPHEAVRTWLLRLAAGEFDAPPPEPS